MASDNICKYLAEEYPADFVRWLSGEDVTDITVIKTELSVEPIRADSLILRQGSNRILHWEFQTLPASEPPLPLRMLDYWVRLKRQYGCHIEQVVIFLKSTTAEAVFVNQLTDVNTSHRYRVIRLWEEDPAPLLATPALLPLATLARSDTPKTLLEQVAVEIDKIEEPRMKGNLTACVDILAGLRFDKNTIRQLFQEEVMLESVTYQDIIQRGLQKGRQEGKEEGQREEALSLLSRQLTRRFGVINPELQEEFQRLSLTQLEDLSEVLLDFRTATDLAVWLNMCQVKSIIIRQLNHRFGEINFQLQQRIQRLSMAQLGELGEVLLDFQTVGDLVVWLDEVVQE